MHRRGELPHAVMTATLTSQLAEFYEGGGERVYQSLEKVRQTVEGTEIYEVIRRRLFENLGDTEEHQKTAEAYWAMYRKLGEDVPSSCRELAYRDDIIKAYPFHPELIHVLYERWGTISEFQRTLPTTATRLYQSPRTDGRRTASKLTTRLWRLHNPYASD